MKLVFQDPTFSLQLLRAISETAFEDRIAACVLYNGVYNGYDVFALGFPQSLRIAVENGNANVVNTVIDILLDIDANMRFNIKTACGLLELIHHLN
jgi:hypothetical protein